MDSSTATGDQDQEPIVACQLTDITTGNSNEVSSQTVAKRKFVFQKANRSPEINEALTQIIAKDHDYNKAGPSDKIIESPSGCAGVSETPNPGLKMNVKLSNIAKKTVGGQKQNQNAEMTAGKQANQRRKAKGSAGSGSRQQQRTKNNNNYSPEVVYMGEAPRLANAVLDVIDLVSQPDFYSRRMKSLIDGPGVIASASNVFDTTGTFPEDDMDDEMASRASVAEVKVPAKRKRSRTQGGINPNQLSMGIFYGINHNHGLTDEFVGEFPHSAFLKSTLEEVFGLQDFRPLQQQALNAALLGHDSFVLMPTGGGKSLIYQLPAVMNQGVTFVISPLISLIRDQLIQLHRLGINAATLSGGVTPEYEAAVYKDLTSQRPKVKLLYVCPERLAHSRSKMTEAMDSLYAKKLISRFVVDEAHCVAHWGHDFRPDYLKISQLRYKYKDIPMMALTATATVNIRQEILNQLKMNINTTKWFLCSFNRPNLRYEVLSASAFKYSPSALCALLQLREYYDKCGIIYCLAKQECMDVAVALQNAGFSAAPYHAGLPDKLRSKTQDDWLNGTVHIICATIAFGMGIDKPDVRFVIHNTLPKSLEGLYQEAGRAGRDGLPADCIVLYSPNDVSRVGFIIDISGKKNPTPQDELHAQQLKKNVYRVEAYCTNSDICRRVQILEYFGEVFDPVNCGRDVTSLCDVCKRQKRNRKRAKEEEEKLKLKNLLQEKDTIQAKPEADEVLKPGNCNCKRSPQLPLCGLLEKMAKIQRECLEELQACIEQQDMSSSRPSANIQLLEMLAVELPGTPSRFYALPGINELHNTQLEKLLLEIIKKYSCQKFDLYHAHHGHGYGSIIEDTVQVGQACQNQKSELETISSAGAPAAQTSKNEYNNLKICQKRKVEFIVSTPGAGNNKDKIVFGSKKFKSDKAAETDGALNFSQKNEPNANRNPDKIIVSPNSCLGETAISTITGGDADASIIMPNIDAEETRILPKFDKTDITAAADGDPVSSPAEEDPIIKKPKLDLNEVAGLAPTNSSSDLQEKLSNNTNGKAQRRRKKAESEAPEVVPQMQTRRRMIKKPTRYST